MENPDKKDLGELRFSIQVWKMEYDRQGRCGVEIDRVPLDEWFASRCVQCEMIDAIAFDGGYVWLISPNCPKTSDGILENGRVFTKCPFDSNGMKTHPCSCTNV